MMSVFCSNTLIFVAEFWKCTLKANLDGMIFACNCRAQLACVVTSQQIVSCKLDLQRSYNTLWMSSKNCEHLDVRKC